MTEISESRTREILHWLDDRLAEPDLPYQAMAMLRDAAALIRQLQASEQAAWRAGLDAGQAEAWQQGYHQGVQDERISEANIGIAGYNAKVEPARINPYLAQQPATVDGAWQNKVADALDSFWNPACGAIQEASYHGPASGSDVVGAIAQGLAAVAASLRESAAQPGGSDNDR